MPGVAMRFLALIALLLSMGQIQAASADDRDEAPHRLKEQADLEIRTARCHEIKTERFRLYGERVNEKDPVIRATLRQHEEDLGTEQATACSGID
jgi:hypothetical protein